MCSEWPTICPSHLPVLLSHPSAPHSPCTRHMDLLLLLKCSPYICLPQVLCHSSDLEGSFWASHIVLSLLYSCLCPLLKPLTTLWNSSCITLLTLLPDFILCVYCLPHLLECLLPEDNNFVWITGVPWCLAQSRCSINVCWGSEFVNRI